MAKYDGLTAYLRTIPSDQLAVTLTLARIAGLVGGLPASAYSIRQWWANDPKVQARAWRAAGWRVDKGGVDFNAQTIRLARGKAGRSNSA